MQVVIHFYTVIASLYALQSISEFVNFLNNNVASPKNAKKHDNNVALAHCVLFFELLTQGVETALLLKKLTNL